VSCAEAKTNIDSDKTPIETTVSESESPMVKDRSTLEGFYNILKTAVVSRDLETLKTLFAEGTAKYNFDDPEEQSLMKATKFSDVTLSFDKNGGKELYELGLIFSVSQEMLDEGMEASQELIYMQKNDNGNFEIFVISFAG